MLVAASKVLEKIVCNQVTRFFEVSKLLPDNQHGFRAHRSTMTALSAMQKDWIKVKCTEVLPEIVFYIILFVTNFETFSFIKVLLKRSK